MTSCIRVCVCGAMVFAGTASPSFGQVSQTIVDYPTAIAIMESYVFPRPDADPISAEQLERILQFVSDDLRRQEAALNAEIESRSSLGLARPVPQSAPRADVTQPRSQQTCEYWELRTVERWERRCFRNRCGRICWRWHCVRQNVWVKKARPCKEYSAGESRTVLRRKLDQLVDKVADAVERGIPTAQLSDLSRQVYGIVLAADDVSPAGSILRAP
jgi:hypothetical protein